VLGHELTIHASRTLSVDAELIPTGELRPVAGTRSTSPGPRGSGRGSASSRAAGTTTATCSTGGEGLELAARLVEPKSGRVMEVHTTEPGSSSSRRATSSGCAQGERVYGRNAGLCLETQHHPDSPNRPSFPSTLLRPDESLRSHTVYAFPAR